MFFIKRTAFLAIFFLGLSSSLLGMDIINDDGLNNKTIKTSAKTASDLGAEKKDLGQGKFLTIDVEKLWPLDGSNMAETLLHTNVSPVRVLAGGPPTFLSRIKYLLQYNLQGWDQTVRMGKIRYQVVMMSWNIGGEAFKDFDSGKKWTQ